MHGTNNTKRTDSNPSLSSSVNSSSSPAREPSRVRNVYVSSLPLGYLDHQLHELMSPFGAVASCRMFNDNKGTATTGHSYGFVLFERSCDAEAACASLDGFTLAGRKLRVQIARNGLVKKSVIRPPPEKAPARNASSSTPPTAPLTASDRTDTPPTPPVVEMVSQTSLPSMRSIHSTSPPPPSTLADSQGSITTYVQMPPTPTNAAMFVPANQPFPPPPVFVSVPWPPTSEWHPVPFISPSLVSSSSSSHTASALPPPHHPSHPSSSATRVNPWTATPHAATSVRLPAPPAPASWFSLEHQQQQRHHPHPHHANTTGPSFVASTSQFDPMTSTTYVQQYSTYPQAAGQHQQPSTVSHQQQQLQLQHHQLQYHHHHHQHAFVQVGQEAPQGVQPVMFPWGFTTAPWLPATTPQNASPAQQQPPQ